MSTGQLLEHLRLLSDAERLEVIETASRLIRESIGSDKLDAAKSRDCRMRAAATRLKSLYEPGGELTEWTALDAEGFMDDNRMLGRLSGADFEHVRAGLAAVFER